MEDDEFQAEVLEGFMGDFGHEASVTYSASEALEILQFNAFDLLLTDLLVLGPDEKGGGITLIKEVRGSAFARLRSLPIIAITGSGKMISPELLGENAQFVGANQVLMKPVSFEMLRASVEKALQG